MVKRPALVNQGVETEVEKIGLVMVATVTLSVASAVVVMLVPAATVKVSAVEIVWGVPEVPAKVKRSAPPPVEVTQVGQDTVISAVSVPDPETEIGEVPVAVAR